MTLLTPQQLKTRDQIDEILAALHTLTEEVNAYTAYLAHRSGGSIVQLPFSAILAVYAYRVLKAGNAVVRSAACTSEYYRAKETTDVKEKTDD
jgi:hypothetical protein